MKEWNLFIYFLFLWLSLIYCWEYLEAFKSMSLYLTTLVTIIICETSFTYA